LPHVLLQHLVLKYSDALNCRVVRKSERVATGCSEQVRQRRGHARGIV
jgi:hypothetical protein